MSVIGRNNRKVICLEVEGVHSWDRPDFSDAFFAYGVYADTGEVLTNDELDELTDKNGDVVNMMANDWYVNVEVEERDELYEECGV